MPETLDLPDLNVLLALVHPSHVHHRPAHEWLAEAPAFATTPVTESGLVRLLMNPTVAGREITGREALTVLAGVRADVRARFLPDDTSLAEPHVGLLGLAGARQVPDWHLLNLAARHGARLVTFDRRLAASLEPGDRDGVLLLG